MLTDRTKEELLKGRFVQAAGHFTGDETEWESALIASLYRTYGDDGDISGTAGTLILGIVKALCGDFYAVPAEDWVLV